MDKSNCNVNRKYLGVIPETMKLLLGEDVTHTVTFEQLNRLINHMEFLPEPLIYHPIIFVSADDINTVIEVGFDAGDNIVFKIGGETKFICAEDYWNNVNFNDLQKFMFMSEEDKYYLLEGTYGGKCITNVYQKVISLKTHEDVDSYFESM